MKIRENLVSNSSSTSFIIAFKSSPPCPNCGRKDPDIVKLVEMIGDYVNSDRNKVEAVGTAGVRDYIAQYFGRESEEDAERILKEVEEYEKKKEWNFGVIRIAHCNNEVVTILNNGIASGDIVELYNSEE